MSQEITTAHIAGLGYAGDSWFFTGKIMYTTHHFEKYGEQPCIKYQVTEMSRVYERVSLGWFKGATTRLVGISERTYWVHELKIQISTCTITCCGAHDD